MTERNRQYLKQEFQDGERPSGDDFADLMDSFLNKLDDGLSIDTDGNLVLSRGLGLGDSASTNAGTLRFNGSTVQFNDGTGWADVGGGGGAFQQVGNTDHVAFDGGNVGIGLSNPPAYRLEVDLGSNTAESERVRFGNAVCSNGSAAFQGYAYFYHRDHASNNAYALRQGSRGNVHLNSPSGQPVSIRQNGTQVRLGISASGNVVVGAENDLSGATASLQVDGDAFKTSGGGNWITASDVRLKDDVRDLEVGLAQLVQVQPVRFRYNGKAGTPPGREGVGVISQEIEKVFPEMVRRVADNPELSDLLLYDGSALTYVLVNAVKELAARVEALEAALAESRGDTGDQPARS